MFKRMLIGNQCHGGVAAQRLGIGTSLVRRRHDPEGIGLVHTWNFRMEFNAQMIAARTVLQEADQGADGRVMRLGAELFRRIQKRAVIARGIRAGEKQFGIGTELFRSGFQRIAQRDIQQAVGIGNAAGPAIEPVPYGAQVFKMLLGKLNCRPRNWTGPAKSPGMPSGH